MEDGIYTGIGFQTYKKIDAINWSTLKPFHRLSGYAAKKYLDEMNEKEPTEDMRYGSLLHLCILEPHRFADEVFIEHKGTSKADKEIKEKQAQIKQENPNALFLKVELVEQAQKAAQLMFENPKFSFYLSGGKPEVTMVWTDRETGLKCKGRLDYLTDQFIVDVKTTRATTRYEFGREVSDRLYHCQMAFYQDGFKTLTGRDIDIVLAASAKESLESWFDVIDKPEILDAGRVTYRNIFQNYLNSASCNFTDKIQSEGSLFFPQTTIDYVLNKGL